jgi:hypothetical protein
MGSLHDTEDALAEQTVADVFMHACLRLHPCLAWEVARCLARLVLALLSAPTFWR